MHLQPLSFLIDTNNLLRKTLFTVGKESISLLGAIELIVESLLVVVAARLVKKFLRERLLAKLGVSQIDREAISTLVSYSACALGLILVLEINAFDLTSLAVVAGGLGVGIGFGLQEFTKNLVAGLTLLVEGKLKLGDYIEFDGMSGYIKEISIRSTLIETFDGADVIVPNCELMNHRVTNWSYKDFKGKIHISIGVAYDSDPILVTETLLNSAYMEPAILHDPSPKVIFKGFSDNSLDFEMWVWVNRIDNKSSIKSSLNFIIQDNFRRADISIPFPQRDLWLRNPEALQASNLQATNQNISESHSLSSLKIAKSLSLRDLLKQVPYFNNFTDLHLRELIEVGYRKSMAKAEVIFHEGELGHTFYLILTGSVELAILKLEQHVKTIRAGDFFGELSLMAGTPYTTTARTLEETILFVIDKHNFEKLLRSRSEFAEIIVQGMAKDKETILVLKQHLQELGLCDSGMTEHNIIGWMRTRLKKIIGL